MFHTLIFIPHIGNPQSMVINDLLVILIVIVILVIIVGNPRFILFFLRLDHQ